MSPGSPALTGTPYQLPAVAGNLINPMSQKIMSYFPLPTPVRRQPAIIRITTGRAAGRILPLTMLWMPKSIIALARAPRFTGRFAHAWGQSDTAPCFNNPWDPCSGFPGNSWAWNGQATLTHNFGSNKVFTATYGFARGGFVNSGFSGKYPSYNLVSDVGFPASLYQLAQLQGVATPTIDLNGAYNSLSNYNGSSIGSANSLFYDRRQSHDILASLDWIKGHHDIKFGGEIRIAQQYTLDVNDPVGAFTFNTLGTSQNSANVNGGDVMATFLTGVSVGGSGGNWNIIQAPAWTAKTWSLYVEDSWRATSKLTVNAGLRYDMQYPGTERHNRLEYFDPTLASPLQVAGMPNLVGGDVFATLLKPGNVSESLLRSHPASLGACLPAERQDGRAERLRDLLRVLPVWSGRAGYRGQR